MAQRSDEDAGLFLERAMRAFQENVRRSGPAAMASYTLIGAIIMFGGIGLVIDRWRGADHWFLLAGLLLGLVVGFVELARTVWRR